MLTLNTINPNAHELEVDGEDGLARVLFSYRSAVAFAVARAVYIPRRGSEPYQRSVTTAKHINMWAREAGRDVVELDADEWTRRLGACVRTS